MGMTDDGREIMSGRGIAGGGGGIAVRTLGRAAAARAGDGLITMTTTTTGADTAASEPRSTARRGESAGPGGSSRLDSLAARPGRPETPSTGTGDAALLSDVAAGAAATELELHRTQDEFGAYRRRAVELLRSAKEAQDSLSDQLRDLQLQLARAHADLEDAARRAQTAEATLALRSREQAVTAAAAAALTVPVSGDAGHSWSGSFSKGVPSATAASASTADTTALAPAILAAPQPALTSPVDTFRSVPVSTTPTAATASASTSEDASALEVARARLAYLRNLLLQLLVAADPAVHKQLEDALVQVVGATAQERVAIERARRERERDASPMTALWSVLTR